jgi:hypothetical protein
MTFSMVRFLISATVLAFVLVAMMGCAKDAAVDVGTLKPAPRRCMEPPAGVEPLKVGDKLVEKHARLYRSYNRETSKLVCAQRYIRTITRQ